ncbi:MAG: CvpA family protein, partial [Oscillospiraceae bacterium]
AGYNYIAKNDDVYMYTGITSVSSDQSNVGFILTNQRTKETTYYAIAGAAEYSAMSSAEGYVQDLGYTSTFPLLLNISKQPTYFMALKDNAGLVKQYAMVNVSSYQVVALGATVRECEMNYLNLLLEQNITEVTELERFEEEGVVREIRSAVIDGNTYYYLKLENSDIFYSISAADSEKAIIVSVGDTVKITYNEKQESQILPTTSLEILNSASAPTPPAKAEAEKPASDNAA